MLAGARDFALLQNALTSTGAGSIPYSMGTRELFQPGHCVGPTPPCSTKAKTEDSYTSTHPYDIMVW